MFNDTMKICVAQCAKFCGEDKAFVVNNFDIINKFKVLTQNVEIIVIANNNGYNLAIVSTEPYPSWEKTPVMILPDELRAKYKCDDKVLLVASGVSVETIDEVLRHNKSTYIGTAYKGKHESSKYLGAIPIREATFSLSITPGIFK